MCRCRKGARCLQCMEKDKFSIVKLPDATREEMLEAAGLDTWSGWEDAPVEIPSDE